MPKVMISPPEAPHAGEVRADETEPLLISPGRARAKLGYGNTKFYELLNSGAIASFRDGAARRVVTASLHEYIARMLAEAGATPAEQPARTPPRPKRHAAYGATAEHTSATSRSRQKRKSAAAVASAADTRTIKPP
jgi:hypothetical protein